MWYFKIVSNFTHLTAGEITYNNFEISLVVNAKYHYKKFNLVITYTKLLFINIFALICLSQLKIIFIEHFSVDQHTILRSYTSISKLQVLPKLCIV